jgi:hypothetical protein
MRCTIVEQKNVSAMLTFVVKPPQIPHACGANVEFIYQNISAKNAFRIIPPCNLRGEQHAGRLKAPFWGDL